MNPVPHVTESEWLVMSELWKESPLTVAELVSRVQSNRDQAPTTIKTLLRRLIAKKAVGYTVDESNQKLFYYSPLVTEQDCLAKQSERFLSVFFDNNVKKLLSTFVDNSGISEDEVESLKALMEKRKDEADK